MRPNRNLNLITECTDKTATENDKKKEPVHTMAFKLGKLLISHLTILIIKQEKVSSECYSLHKEPGI